MLHGSYRYEPKLRSFYRDCMSKVVTLALENELDVVIDRTHLTREARQQWTSLAEGLKPYFHPPIHSPIEMVAVLFPVEDLVVHLNRRIADDDRGRSIEDWGRVVAHHYEQYKEEEPTLDRLEAEGFDYWKRPSDLFFLKF